MVGTCLDPPLWSDLKTKDERAGRCERKEKLTICAMPPSSKDTVFTQVDSVGSCQIKIKIFFSDCSSCSSRLLVGRHCPHTISSSRTCSHSGESAGETIFFWASLIVTFIALDYLRNSNLLINSLKI